MSGMQKIEAAVGEDEALPGNVHFIAQAGQLARLDHASLVHGPSNRIPPAIAQDRS
jgi:hypothetical protein